MKGSLDNSKRTRYQRRCVVSVDVENVLIGKLVNTRVTAVHTVSSLTARCRLLVESNLVYLTTMSQNPSPVVVPAIKKHTNTVV
uniref:Sm domain-containing protein n=1 Tax=Heterorhabditis bacteriophora TaxID=37862 RepID=A0A1I7WPF3_HETBA